MITAPSLRCMTSEWYGRRDLPVELRCPHTGFSGPHSLEALPTPDFTLRIYCHQCRQMFAVNMETLYMTSSDIAGLAEMLDRCVVAMAAPFWNQDWGSPNPDESEAW